MKCEKCDGTGRVKSLLHTAIEELESAAYEGIATVAKAEMDPNVMEANTLIERAVYNVWVLLEEMEAKDV